MTSTQQKIIELENEKRLYPLLKDRPIKLIELSKAIAKLKKFYKA